MRWIKSEGWVKTGRDKVEMREIKIILGVKSLFLCEKVNIRLNISE